MCLSIPAKVEKIDGNSARVSINDCAYEVRVDLVEGVKVGDYVIVHSGYAIEKMNEEMAMETFKYINEVMSAG